MLINPVPPRSGGPLIIIIIHKVRWLREASQISQTFIPLCEKVVTQRGRFQIDSAILAAVRHPIIAKQKPETRNRRPFLLGGGGGAITFLKKRSGTACIRAGHRQPL